MTDHPYPIARPEDCGPWVKWAPPKQLRLSGDYPEVLPRLLPSWKSLLQPQALTVENSKEVQMAWELCNGGPEPASNAYRLGS